MREVFTFELVLHYEPEYEGSVNELKKDIRRAVMCMDGVQDMEVALTERETIGE